MAGDNTDPEHFSSSGLGGGSGAPAAFQPHVKALSAVQQHTSASASSSLQVSAAEAMCVREHMVAVIAPTPAPSFSLQVSAEAMRASEQMVAVIAPAAASSGMDPALQPVARALLNAVMKRLAAQDQDHV